MHFSPNNVGASKCSDMGRTCEKCVQNFCLKNLKGRDYLEDLGVDGWARLE